MLGSVSRLPCHRPTTIPTTTPISKQRADEYCHTEQEAAESNFAYAPPSDAWPDKGDVRVEHLTLRYPSAATCVAACSFDHTTHRPPTFKTSCLYATLTHNLTTLLYYPPTTRPVIRDLSFAIPPGTRVGVVGRTGTMP